MPLHTRREFIGLALAAAGIAPVHRGRRGGSARLTVRPHAPKSSTLAAGVTTLALSAGQQAFLFVPAGYTPAKSWPLVLALHGATQRHTMQLNLLAPFADAKGFLVLAPDSADISWDAIRGDFSVDLASINEALSQTFDRARIDPAHVILEGFSDGASYALALGCANGDLFHRVVAFSPGFIPDFLGRTEARPRFFISHGRQDPILPIDDASRRIVPELRRAGYDVTFREFDGGHTPRPLAADAVDWMLA